PKIHVVLAWNGQSQAFPNPVSLAEAIQNSGDFDSWSRLPNTTNILGYTYGYALQVSAPKPDALQTATGLGGGLHIKRPDGTVLACLSEFDDLDQMRSGTLSVYDDTGKLVTAKVMLEREQDNDPFRVTEVRWDPDTGYERIWTVNRF